MLRFLSRTSYYWFDAHVEACADFKYQYDGDNVKEVPGRSFIKYQIIKDAQDCDFSKYDCAIFEKGGYPFKV